MGAGGPTGMFPTAFVDVVEDVPLEGPQVLATYDFVGERACELSFQMGEMFRLLGRIDDEWMRGEYKGLVGAFPSVFVDVVEDLPAGTPHEGWPEAWKQAEDEPEPEEPDTPLAAAFGDMPCGRALFDFEAVSEGDLPFAQDDIILLLQQVDDQWLRGRFGTREGVFPADFVEILVPLPDEAARPKQSQGAGAEAGLVSEVSAPQPAPRASLAPAPDTAGTGMARVVFEYAGDEPGDLPLPVVGEEVVVLQRIDAEWLRGALGGHEGMFPASFVEVIREPQAPAAGATAPTATAPEPTPEPAAPTKTGIAEALFDYESTEADDLTFQAGSGIVLLARVGADWFRGSIGPRVGLFPASFVEVVVDLE